MNFKVYIIYSERWVNIAVGSTDNFERRIEQHNNGKGNFTSKGIPWKVVKIIECSTRTVAIKLERQIKKRGIRRFIEDLSTNI